MYVILSIHIIYLPFTKLEFQAQAWSRPKEQGESIICETIDCLTH